MEKNQKFTKIKRLFLKTLVAFFLLLSNVFFLEVSAQVASFPGAQGGGASSVGGRGGEVYYVTTLADSGPGSLREALENDIPRYVLFKVGGVIKLLTPIEIGSYKTIAGQTAPGGGITITAESMTERGPLFFVYLKHDVFIRYVTLRHGVNVFTPTGLQGDATISESNFSVLGSYNVLVDHCTATWGNVNNLGPWSADGTVPSYNFTVQWSILAEAPYTNQSTGFNAGGDAGAMADAALDVDVHHNLFTANGHRNPLLKVNRGRVINNIISNWGYFGAGYVDGSKIDIIGNLFKETTRSDSTHVIVYEGDTPNEGPSGITSIYVAGNKASNQTNPAADNWNMMRDKSNGNTVNTTFKRSPFVPFASSFLPFNITVDNVDSLNSIIPSTVGNYQKFNANGSRTNRRDANDSRIITNYQNGTSWEITNQNDVGGFPTISPGTAYVDSDNDGMPDLWETANGFNNAVNDANGDANGDGYKNIEEFLNGTGISGANSGAAVTGMSVAPTTGSVSLYETNPFIISANVLPGSATNQNITWSSSNVSVATVNAFGQVSPVGIGAATITATSQDGAKTASCAFTVISDPPNFLVNGGFENQLSTGWTIDFGNSAQNTNTAYVNTGTASLVVGNAVSTVLNGQGGRAQTVTTGFTVGTSYVLSANCRMLAAGTGASYIGVQCRNVNDSTLKEVPSSNITSTTFTKKEVTFTVPANTTKLRIYLWYDGGNTSIYADDYSLSGIPVTGVTVSPKTLCINVGGISQLTATVAPSNAFDKIVSYTTTNPAVATVSSSGLVSAIAGGTASIVITTRNGLKKDTCVVTANNTATNLIVNPGFESSLSTGWTFSYNNSSTNTNSSFIRSGVKSLRVGKNSGGRAQEILSGFSIGSTYTLSAYARLGASTSNSAYIGVQCRNSSGTIISEFTSSNITTTSYVQKKVTFTVPANTTILRVYLWYDGGLVYVYADDYALVAGSSPGNRTVVNVNSLLPELQSTKYSVYPNPVTDFAKIIFGKKLEKNASMNVVDINGRVVLYSGDLNNQEYVNLDLSKLPSGYYFAILRNKKERKTVKILKK